MTETLEQMNKRNMERHEDFSKSLRGCRILQSAGKYLRERAKEYSQKIVASLYAHCFNDVYIATGKNLDLSLVKEYNLYVGSANEVDQLSNELEAHANEIGAQGKELRKKIRELEKKVE